MKTDILAILVFITLAAQQVKCRNDLVESISEKRVPNNSIKPRTSKSTTRIIEKTISAYNVTDANNTLSVVNSIAQIDIVKTKQLRKKNKKAKQLFVCPIEKQAPFQLIPTLCRRNRDCRKQGSNVKCCYLFGSKRCVPGVPAPIPEPSHDPIFGIPRRCPKQPLTETFWDIQTCETDNDCWPRVCCPDGGQKYCRTSQPVFEESENAAARQLAYPIEAVSQYLQCTPPPPVIFDVHPKVCNTTLDCFPNLCCQEAGKRHCRPPKRSLLALVTGLTSRINIGFIRDLTDNLVIRR
ncbi:uncharacterized protein LOC129739402 [Uranotaenia lowii]|uniref:uncharacterized protein LOC129739402 n=1 Tax=Uranotaenia lowii TaxID=190385 RepID=UPI00247A1C73|nr:uncharacterized protein LOC129739402 [Uranotaenia lowii]